MKRLSHLFVYLFKILSLLYIYPLSNINKQHVFLVFFFRDNYRQQQPKPHPIGKVSFQIVCYVVRCLLLADDFSENDLQRTFFGWHVCVRIFYILKCASRQCQREFPK